MTESQLGQWDNIVTPDMGLGYSASKVILDATSSVSDRLDLNPKNNTLYISSNVGADIGAAKISIYPVSTEDTGFPTTYPLQNGALTIKITSCDYFVLSVSGDTQGTVTAILRNDF